VRIGFMKRFKTSLLSLFIFVVTLATIPIHIKGYPHIPLKGLFEILKKDDIGFGYVLLHAKWIENMYQYGAGKPHRQVEVKNRTRWRIEEKNDAVANLVRTFWFRRAESHQLLPTQFSVLASIPHDNLGSIFGLLMNYVYNNFDSQLENRLIEEMLQHDEKARDLGNEIEKLQQEVEIEKKKLEDEKFVAVEQANQALKQKREQLKLEYKRAEFNEELKGIKQAHKKDKVLFRQEQKKLKEKYKEKEFNVKRKQAEKDVFSNISKETQKEYRKIKQAIGKIEGRTKGKMHQRTKAIKKEFLYPIEQAWKLCKRGGTYASRMAEGILWALFFHMLDDFASMEHKITAINDCINIIGKEFKRENFQKHSELKKLYTEEDLDDFRRKIEPPNFGWQFPETVNRQVDIIFEQYDVGLHYFISRVAGNLPPTVPQGSHGYEYEEGKISSKTADCHETATLDVLSILWYNQDENCFDDSLFPEHVIKDGKGLKKLREALKYFYLADCKGIKAEEYTWYMSKDGGTTFTSLAKLKKLGKISEKELEELDISKVPVSYITHPEIKQEFMNIVSGIPGAFYCSEVPGRGKIFELETDVRNIVTIFNYLYGTRAKSVAELGDKITGISTDSRTITFEQESEKNTPNTVKISIDTDKEYSDTTMMVNIGTRHTSLSGTGRGEGSGYWVSKKLICNNILKRMFANVQEEEETEGELESDSESDSNHEAIENLKRSSILMLLNSKKVFENKDIPWNAPTLNLCYYSLFLQSPEIKTKVLESLLLNRAFDYETAKFFVHNLIEGLPVDRAFGRPLCFCIFATGRHLTDDVLARYFNKYEQRYQYALGGAVSRGCVQVVRRLLEREDIDVNLFPYTDWGYRTNLMEAAEKGYTQVVRLLLKYPDVNVNWRNYEGNTTLIEIVKRGYKEIVALLLEYSGVDIYAQNKKGKTVFDYAQEKPEIAELLKKRLRIIEESAPLIEAAHNGDLQLVKRLLKDSAVDVNVIDKDGNAPLTEAVSEGHTEIVGLLLGQKDIQVNLRANAKTGDELAVIASDKYFGGEKLKSSLSNSHFGMSKNDLNDTVLITAIKKGQTDIVKMLLERPDVDVNMKGAYGKTPLIIATWVGQKDIVQLLLNHPQIDVNFQTGRIQPALLVATWLGHTDIVQLLLKHPRIDKNIQNRWGETAFFLSISLSRKKIAKLLLKDPQVDITLRDRNGRTPLEHVQGKNDKNESQKFFLDYMHLLDAIANDSLSAKDLLIASKVGRVDVVRELLIHQGADVNMYDEKERKTALMLAAAEGNVEVVKLLLEHQDVQVNRLEIVTDVSSDGSPRSFSYPCEGTPLVLAAENGHLEVLKILLGYEGVKVNRSDCSGKTALIVAAVNGDTEVVRLLLERKDIDINYMGHNGDVALIAACKNGHKDVAKLLLAHPQIDVNVKDCKWKQVKKELKNGWVGYTNVSAKWFKTAIMLADSNDQPELIEILLRDKKVDFRKQQKHPKVLLVNAAHKGYKDVVKLLLDYPGTGLQSQDVSEALIWACGSEHKNHKNMVKLLLDSGDLGKQKKNLSSAISVAFKKDRINLVALLLKRHPDLI